MSGAVAGRYQIPASVPALPASIVALEARRIAPPVRSPHGHYRSLRSDWDVVLDNSRHFTGTSQEASASDKPTTARTINLDSIDAPFPLRQQAQRLTPRSDDQMAMPPVRRPKRTSRRRRSALGTGSADPRSPPMARRPPSARGPEQRAERQIGGVWGLRPYTIRTGRTALRSELRALLPGPSAFRGPGRREQVTLDASFTNASALDRRTRPQRLNRFENDGGDAAGLMTKVSDPAGEGNSPNGDNRHCGSSEFVSII